MGGLVKMIFHSPKAETVAPPPALAEKPVITEVDQEAEAEKSKLAERRRRALVAQQNSLIKTSALGAELNQQKLGGRVSLTGE